MPGLSTFALFTGYSTSPWLIYVNQYAWFTTSSQQKYNLNYTLKRYPEEENVSRYLNDEGKHTRK